MASDTGAVEKCAAHGMPLGNCYACELSKGERIAAALATVMRDLGLVDPAEQFATMLGLAVAGFARGGTELSTVLDAVTRAFERAKQ